MKPHRFIYQRLRRYRERAGLSRPRLVEAFRDAGVRLSERKLFAWEHGTARPDTTELAVVAMLFGVEIEAFYAAR